MRLTRRRLNRATLARQSLLARERLEVVTAVERFGGLQAQEPASPYVGLWTRLEGFGAEELDLALQAYDVIKATLQRSTLHLLSQADYLASVAALSAVTRSKWTSESRGRPVERDLPELTAESLAYATVPRTNVELRDHAGTLGEPVPADELWRRIRRYGTFLHVPGAETWSFGRRPRLIAAEARLRAASPDEAAGLEHIVRTHLRAFGPSRLADMAQWSGLTVRRLRIGLERIPELISHEDETGRRLYDLPGAALPDEDVPAPPRLLPMWDETLLAYADRGRTLPERYRKRVIVKAGDVLPAFTVDGYVAGLWWAEEGTGGRSHIVLEPFEPLAPHDRVALETEAESLASFVAPREPAVYRRYRHTRRRA